MSGADAETVREALRVGSFHSVTEREFAAVSKAPAALERLAVRVAEAEKALAEYEGALQEIAGPTPTSHRKTVDQLIDAVKWRQGIARDALARAPLQAGVLTPPEGRTSPGGDPKRTDDGEAITNPEFGI